MSNLGLLLKVSLRESLDLRKAKKNNNNKKALGFAIYLSLMLLLFIGISIFYNFLYGMQFHLLEDSNRYASFTLLAFGVAMMLTFSTSLAKMQTVFVGRDYELLSSLPIRKRDIVLSKIFSLYLVELVYSLIIFIPNSIITTILSKDLTYLLVILLSFVSPAYAMLLSLLMVSLINLLIKNKKVRDIISMIVAIAFIGFAVGYALMSGFSTSGNPSTRQAEQFMGIVEIFKYINPTLLFIELGYTSNLLWILLYVFADFLLLVIVLAIVCAFYNKIHQNMEMNSKAKSSKYKTKYKIRSQFEEVMHATVGSFFRSKTFLLQTGIGIFLSVLMGILAIVILKTTPIKDEEGNIIAMSYEYIYNFAFVVPIGISMFTAIVPPSGVAISLEGESFFILKSTPIDFKKYCLAKILFSIIVLTVPMIILSIVYSILVPQSVLSIIVSIIFPLLFAIFTSSFSLFTNIKAPYLHYENEIEVFKNHKSTVITAFTDMLGSNFTLGIAIILAVFVSGIISGIVIIALYIFLDILFLLLVFKNGVKSLYNFEEN